MAHLRHNAARDRGQLIISAGLIIAMVLIGLTIILNSTLYVQNYTAQPHPHGIDRAEEAMQVTYSITRSAMENANAELYTTNGAAIDNVSQTIRLFDNKYQRRMFLLHGVITNIDIIDTRKAWIVTQTSAAEFRASSHTLSSSYTDDWVMGSFTGIRNVSMTVLSASEWEQNASDELFHVRVKGESGQWTMWVFNHPSRDHIAIGTHINTSTGSPVIACSAPRDGDGVTISTDPLTIDGEQCGNIVFGNGTGDGPYTIVMHDGDNATGTYRFTLGRGHNAHLADEIPLPYIRNTLDGDEPKSTDPTAYDGVYSLTVHISIHGQAVNASTKRTIAPKEPETTEPNNAIP